MRWTLLLIAMAGLGAAPARAGWIDWPGVNLPVCTAGGDQVLSTIVADGSGGAIIAWFDLRSGSGDIYAQHVLLSGAVDPAWPANGTAQCTAAYEQTYPVIVTDGAGGAICGWQDTRNGRPDFYAQHVLAAGAVDPAWPANGTAQCTAAYEQTYPVIVTDSAGGAIVSWIDSRGEVFRDIYAHHVLATGVVDPAWPIDGRALCTATGSQASPTIVADGAGGAIRFLERLP